MRHDEGKREESVVEERSQVRKSHAVSAEVRYPGGS